MSAIGIVACLCFPWALIVMEVSRRWLAARASGWRWLGRRYPGGRRGAGRRVYGGVRVNDRACDPSLVVTVSGAGLHLAMRSLVARAAHPPLFIPWDDVTVVIDDVETAGDLPLWVGEPASTLTLSGPLAGAITRLLARRRSRPARRPRR